MGLYDTTVGACNEVLIYGTPLLIGSIDRCPPRGHIP